MASPLCFVEEGFAIISFMAGLAFWFDITMLFVRLMMSRAHWIPGRRQAYLADFIDSILSYVGVYVALYIFIMGLFTWLGALGVTVTPQQVLYNIVVKPVITGFSVLSGNAGSILPACA